VRTSRTTSTALLGGVLAALLALTACGDGGGGDTAAPSSPPASTASAAPTTPAPTTSATSPVAPAPTTPAPSGTVITLAYAGKKISGDTGRVKVKVGEQVTLRVTSDVKEEVHNHASDGYLELTPGVPAEMTFTVKAPGIYEVELHDAKTVLTRLEVS
jgi:hypothetical protein